LKGFRTKNAGFFISCQPSTRHVSALNRLHHCTEGIRYGRLDRGLRAGEKPELHPFRMEHQAGESLLETPVTVAQIPYQRMPDAVEVDPDLMPSAGEGNGINQRV
jgi:hypothetical protein